MVLRLIRHRYESAHFVTVLPPNLEGGGVLIRSTRLMRAVLALLCLISVQMTVGGEAAQGTSASTDPVILAPLAGQVVPASQPVHLTVDFSQATEDEFFMTNDCFYDRSFTDLAYSDKFVNNASLYRYWDRRYRPEVFDVDLESSSDGPLYCLITIEGQNEAASSQYSISEPNLVISDVGVSVARFFPIVRDGYSDSVSFAWYASQAADTSITVEAEEGGAPVVQSTALGQLSRGRHTWTWSGLDTSGATVAPGAYVITLAATGATGVTRRASRIVEAVTERRVIGKGKVTVGGDATDEVRKSKSCSVVFTERGGGAISASCRRRSDRVVISYLPRLPSGAEYVDYRVVGSYAGNERYLQSKAIPEGSTARVLVELRGELGYVIVRQVSVQYRRIRVV